ncbi:MAG: hypothetical protein ABGW97_16100 [Christiangramia sp.]|uniref:hypothetical protein n=1 Tax=Christiangramia sp. TaxID=1931228 RepID=UPI0032423E56
MKKIALLIMLVSSLASAQLPYTNRPDLVRPLLDEFRKEALERGVEVKERLAAIDSIMIVEQPENRNGKPSLAGYEADGITWTRGQDIWIELKRSKMEENDGSRLRLFLHELGHAMGLDDCCLCHYNIMRCQASDRANFLFRDEDLARIYLDAFFEAIRNPKKWNDGHTHY